MVWVGRELHTLRGVVGDWDAAGFEVGVCGAVGDVEEGSIFREGISDLRGCHVDFCCLM